MEHLKQIEAEYRDSIQEHWNSDCIFTDAWDNDLRKNQVAENELLLCELSAVMFTVGCYTVRSSFRVYQSDKTSEDADAYIPADKETLDYVRKFEDAIIHLYDGRLMSEYRNRQLSEWEGKIKVRHEIMAKHNADPNGGFANGFINICSADMRGRDHIKCICTIKANNLQPDAKASLFVLRESGEYTSENWYLLDFCGVVSELQNKLFG